MIKSGDAQAIAIWEEYNKSAMTAFPQLSNADIDNILAYTDYVAPPPPPGTAPAAGTQVAASGVSNDLILAALALVFTVLIVMLFLVNKTLQKIATASGVELVAKKLKNQEDLYGTLLLKIISWCLCRLSFFYYQVHILLMVSSCKLELIKVICRCNRFIILTRFTQEQMKSSVSIVTLQLECLNTLEFHRSMFV